VPFTCTVTAETGDSSSDRRIPDTILLCAYILLYKQGLDKKNSTSNFRFIGILFQEKDASNLQ
jgi:hypothetical protein